MLKILYKLNYYSCLYKKELNTIKGNVLVDYGWNKKLLSNLTYCYIAYWSFCVIVMT